MSAFTLEQKIEAGLFHQVKKDLIKGDTEYLDANLARLAALLPKGEKVEFKSIKHDDFIELIVKAVDNQLSECQVKLTESVDNQFEGFLFIKEGHVLYSALVPSDEKIVEYLDAKGVVRELPEADVEFGVSLPTKVLMVGNEVRRYTSVGGYPIFYMNDGNEVFCPSCALLQQKEEPRDYLCGQVNWEDVHLHCDECGEKIDSAYAE